MTTFERIKELAKKRGYTLSSLNDKAGRRENCCIGQRDIGASGKAEITEDAFSAVVTGI